MRILHGTNFTAEAERAGRLARSLVQQLEGQLTVCYVLEPPGATSLAYLSATPPGRHVVPTSQEIDFHYRVQAGERQKRAELRQGWIRQLEVVTPEDATSEFLTGDAVDQLATAAAAHDLLVMGWGPTTRRLLRSAPVPVLVASEGTAVTRIDRVLVGTDFRRASTAALHWVRRLQPYGVEIVLAHVAPSGAAERAERRLDELADDLGVERVVRPGTAAEELPRLAAELDADAIAIGSKGRPPLLEALLRGTGRSLLGTGRHAVLSVPAR